jgi:protein-tyrosine kinase
MSKYFEATLKARTAAPTEAVPQQANPTAGPVATAPLNAVPQPVPVVPVVDTPVDVHPNKIATVRRAEIPFERVPQLRFGINDSVGSVEEAYRALRTRLVRLTSTQGVRSVVITSAVQGEGKTLTALNLALACARLNDMRVLLVDADIRSAGLSRRLELPEQSGLAEVLSGQCQPEEAILGTSVPNLHVLGARPRTEGPAELFADRRWRDFVGWCNGKFGLILVDAPPILNLSDVELITAGCDGILMVVRALITKRQTLEKCAGQIDTKKLLGVVYNGTDSTKRVSYGYTEAPRKGLVA